MAQLTFLFFSTPNLGTLIFDCLISTIAVLCVCVCTSQFHKASNSSISFCALDCYFRFNYPMSKAVAGTGVKPVLDSSGLLICILQS